MAIAAFNVPVPAKSTDVVWEQLDLGSLPEVLQNKVVDIHEAEQALKAMKAEFADAFNNAYSEAVPAGYVRRFGFKFNGLSFGNVVPNTTKGGKAKVTFTAKKGK